MNSDWSTPVTPAAGMSETLDFDWSTPVSSIMTKADTLELDWSQPVMSKQSDELELAWSDNGADSDSDSDGGITMKQSVKKDSSPEPVGRPDELEQETAGLDIMAQQLKFIACLKILMAEMATLATGFEVDGGQLRLQLYLWLDRELQVCKFVVLPSRSRTRSFIFCSLIGVAATM